jgi:phage terminase small subunit
MMPAMPAHQLDRPKRTRGPRRDLAPLPAVDGTEWGPCMKALASDRHRMFVLALYQIKPGYGANVKAAKMAGFGTATSSAKSWSVIASRLAHDEKILAAIHEEDQKRIRASAPRAIQALHNLIEDPTAKDHARGIAMVLDRVHPTETVHNVKVEGKIELSARETAQVLERIEQLAAKFAVRLPAPKVIEGELHHDSTG